jgi:hypothetical protein
VFDLLTGHGFNDAVVDAVGEVVVEAHNDSVTLPQLVTVLLRTPGVEPEAALDLQQRVAQVQRP